jgi:hypothetical protein
MSTSKAPSTSLRTSTQVAGFPLSFASLGEAISRTIVPTTASPINQPATKVGPFARARGVTSMRMTAMIGIGLSATPTANDNDCPIASPSFFSFQQVTVVRGRVGQSRAMAAAKCSSTST